MTDKKKKLKELRKEFESSLNKMGLDFYVILIEKTFLTGKSK